MDLHEHFIASFVEEIAKINGTEFEFLCRYVMEILTESEIVLKGHNLYMKPVGHSVDLIKDSYIVGQCGTEKNYFTSDKPLLDIEGCLKNSPGCKHIYLFSNKRASGKSFNTKLNEINQHYSRFIIDLYDSQKIGEAVYSNIFRTKQVVEILHFLPAARQYYLIMPQTNNLPVLSSNYVKRKEEASLINLLQSNGYIQLFGLSGIGKSKMALSIAWQISDNYDTVLWFNGEKVNVDDFSTVRLERSGENINLKTVLTQFKVLLVADNLNNGVKSFIENFCEANKNGSHCIITSLQKNIDYEHSFEVTYVDRKISKQILCQTTKPPTEEQANLLLDHISGYPLLLELSRNTVENGNFTWEELVKCDNLTELPDEERNIAFARRIVGKYSTEYKELFCILIQLNSISICSDFLKSIHAIKTNNLIRFAILQANEEYCYQIHIVVLEAIRNVMGKDAFIELHKYLLDYLKKHVTSRDTGLYSFMRFHRDVCTNIMKQLSSRIALKHYLVLAFCYTMDTYQNHDDYITKIDELNLDPSSLEIDLNLLIEKMEISQNKLIKSGKDPENMIRDNIKYLNEMVVTSTNQKAHIYHHIGKLYNILKEEPQAEDYYNEALKCAPLAYNTMLQLARLYNKSDNTDGVKEIVGKILNKETINSVPVPILLATYGLLSPSKYSDIRDSYFETQIDFFISTVYASLSQGYTQTYWELSRLSRYLSYQFPSVYNQLCARLPLPLDIDNNMQVRENYGNIMAAQYEYCENKDEEFRNKIFHKAEMYLRMGALDNDYKRKSLFDLYISAEKVDDALRIAATYDNQKDIYLHQGLSKVYRLKNDYNKALSCVNFSIDNEGKAYDGHRAAFRHDKALCLRGLGSPSCYDYMKEAISLQPSEKVRNQWKEELAQWNN